MIGLKDLKLLQPKKTMPRLIERVRGSAKTGQSLVEMAITAPLLLLMFLGVFEVGWALRGYMVLVNANREATRLAVKTGTLDFSTKTRPISDTVGSRVGYTGVLSHTYGVLGYRGDIALTDSAQRPTLPLRFLPESGGGNATMIISHLVASTRNPCDDIGACDCSITDHDHDQWDESDDLLLGPGSSGFDYYQQHYGPTQTVRSVFGRPTVVDYSSRIDFEDKLAELKTRNNQLNCALLKSNPDADLNNSDNNSIIIEMFYDQPQLLGVPIISNGITDPIPLYTHTAMRIITSRDADTAEVIGPVCELYPLALPETVLGASPVPGSTPVDVYQEGGAGPDYFYWVTWDPAGDDAFVVESLTNPRLSINRFTAVGEPDDHLLSADGSDQLDLLSDQDPGSQVNPLLEGLVGARIRVPVIDGGNNITRIAWLSINQVDLSGGRLIRATFNGYDAEACVQ